MRRFQWLWGMVLGALFMSSASMLQAQSRPAAPSQATSHTSSPEQTLWKNLQSLHQWSQRLETQPPALDSLFQLDCSLQAQPEARRTKELRAQARGVDGATGLELRARFEYETEAGQFGDVEEANFDEIAGGLSGTYAGVRWNLLGGGLADYNREADLLELQADEQHVQAQITQQRRRNRCRARRVQEQVNGLLVQLLEKKIELGEQWTKTMRRAYLEGEVELEELLFAQQEIQTAKRQLQTRKQNFRARPVRQLTRLPPLVGLNFSKLEQQIQDDQRLTRLQELSRQVADQQDKTQLGTRLALFGRYEFDQRDRNGNQEFVGEGVAAGVQITQPLGGPDRHPRDQRKATRRAEIAHQQSEWQAGLATVQQRMMEDRTRATNAYYRSLRWQERLRASLAQHRLQEGELGEAVERASQLVDATIEYTRALGEVYEEVGRAFEASRQPLDLSLVRLDTLPSVQKRGRTGHRSLYIWSEGFKEHSNEFLLDLAQAQGLGTLVVSAGLYTPDKKLQKLLRQATQRNVQVEMMLATNQWIYPDYHDSALQRIHNLSLQGLQQAGWLHLDIEPHGLDDPQVSQAKLRAHYLDLVQKIRQRLPEDVQLSVSVPVWWEADMYRQLAPHIDRVYLMAYANQSIEEKAQKIAELKTLLGNTEIVVALEAQEFPNAWTLDRAIRTLQAVANVDHVALHHLQTWLPNLGGTP